MTKGLSKAYGWHKESRELLFNVSSSTRTGYIKYTQCVTVGVCTICEKAEELLAAGFVNAEGLYGFKRLGKNMKEKSVGILLNTVMK